MDGSDEDEGDIEAAIQKEVGSLKAKNKVSPDSPFTEVRLTQECLLFMKCKAPVEPVDFCRRICQDVLIPGNDMLKARYLNRLTPISVVSNATQNGVEKGARQALAGHFKLKPKETTASAESGDAEEKVEVSEGAEPEAQPATVSASMHMIYKVC